MMLSRNIIIIFFFFFIIFYLNNLLYSLFIKMLDFTHIKPSTFEKSSTFNNQFVLIIYFSININLFTMGRFIYRISYSYIFLTSVLKKIIIYKILPFIILIVIIMMSSFFLKLFSKEYLLFLIHTYLVHESFYQFELQSSLL